MANKLNEMKEFSLHNFICHFWGGKKEQVISVLAQPYLEQYYGLKLYTCAQAFTYNKLLLVSAYAKTADHSDPTPQASLVQGE